MRGSRRGALILCALAILVAAGCTDSTEPSAGSGEEGGARRSKDKAEVARTCIDNTEAPENKIARPAIAVKIENSPQARPQSGLAEADLVYEEIVEGGITRFMAIFHCGQTDKAGPVRSARFDDAKIALPFTNILAYSGSNSIVDKELEKRKMVLIDELNGGEAFYRIPPGSTDVHSLYVDTEKVRAQAPNRAPDPTTPDFRLADLPDDAGKARSVTLNFNPNNTIEYRWQGGSWKRFEDGQAFQSANGGQIGVDNLIVQQVKVSDSDKIVDVAGNPSPDITLKGRGKAWLLRDGRVAKGGWAIKKEGTPAKFTSDGQEFAFKRGNIWIELIPSKQGSVKGAVKIK